MAKLEIFVSGVLRQKLAKMLIRSVVKTKMVSMSLFLGDVFVKADAEAALKDMAPEEKKAPAKKAAPKKAAPKK